ncbi:hypothetical protein ACWIVY_06605, partial [Ursidibacter sp. B-7004-1]
ILVKKVVDQNMYLNKIKEKIGTMNINDFIAIIKRLTSNEIDELYTQLKQDCEVKNINCDYFKALKDEINRRKSYKIKP